MDYLWQVHFQYTWVGLFALIVELALLYFILQLFRRSSLLLTTPVPWQLRLKKITHYTLLLFEPAVLLMLFSYFVLIHPFFHGLILLLLVLINFNHLRNYFSGRIILFDPFIHTGSRLSSGKQPNGNPYIKGIITKTGRFAIRVQTDKGLQVVTYNNLLQQPYSLLDREEKGGFFKLKISLPANDKKQASAYQQLIHLFNVSPYINWNHQPEVKKTTDNNQWMAHIALHYEQNLYDLMELLEERGFSCQIAKL